jgi:hypothetical protein
VIGGLVSPVKGDIVVVRESVLVVVEADALFLEEMLHGAALRRGGRTASCRYPTDCITQSNLAPMEACPERPADPSSCHAFSVP